MLLDRHLTGPLAVVSDSNVADIYAPPVIASLHHSGFSADSIVIPAGEENKTFAYGCIISWTVSLMPGWIARAL